MDIDGERGASVEKALPFSLKIVDGKGNVQLLRVQVMLVGPR